MNILHSSFIAQIGRSFSLGLAAFAVVVVAPQLRAATGSELLMSSLSASDMNKTVIDCEALNSAVTQAVMSSKDQAPEIVAVAITKTRSQACQKSLLQAGIRALGDYKSVPRSTIPNIVGAAIRASSNCSTGDEKGYVKGETAGCECAEVFTRAAIEALGSDPSERLVTDITAAAIQATGGRCADRIVSAASAAAPQFADAIADIGARASQNGGADPGNTSFDAGEPLVFGPNGVPLPSVFTSNSPGIVSTPLSIIN